MDDSLHPDWHSGRTDGRSAEKGGNRSGPMVSTGRATGPGWHGSGPATRPAAVRSADASNAAAGQTGASTTAPVLDGRDGAAILDTLESRLPFYTGDRWHPDEEDVGGALLELFSGMAEDVVERLDRLPEKHRRAFVDELGFDQRPPQSARVPVTVSVSEGAGSGISVPPRTRLTADIEDGDDRTFELQSGFEATPASLDRVVAVDPDLDYVVRTNVPDADSPDVDLFGAHNDQVHRLYLGHSEMLALPAGARVRVTLSSTAPEAWLYGLDWEYFGLPEAESDEDPGWQSLADPDSNGNDPPDSRGSLPVQWSDLDRGTIERRVQELGDRLLDVDDRTVRRWLRKQAVHGGPLAEFARSEQLRTGDLDPASSPSRHVLEFQLPGPVEPETVDGVERCWIRCSIPSDAPPAVVEHLSSIEVTDVQIGGGTGPHAPDSLLADDVPLEVPPEGSYEEGDEVDTAPDRELVYPFGRMPRPGNAFYVADEEAFTKRGETVTLTFKRDQITESIRFPHVSWEYYNGDGWSTLPIVDSSPNRALHAGPFYVEFTVPEDLEPTEVAGHEGHWIRTRLVDGGYGDTEEFTEWEWSDPPEGIWQRIDEVNAPAFFEIEVSYGSSPGATPTALLAERELDYERLAPTGSVRPFAELSEEQQAVYLAADDQLSGGPLQLYLSVEDATYPPSFSPRIRWEAWTAEGWLPLQVRDGTEGFRETGIVRCTLPEPTVERERFGVAAHWLRARVRTPAGFYLDPTTPVGSPEEDSDTSRRCARPLSTAPPGAGPKRPRPAVSIALLNTGMATDGRTISEERLGSSDGTPGQSFTVSSPPAREPELWVDELATLSEGARAALRATASTSVRAEGPPGDRDAFWVQWERVDDLLSSGPKDRHYEFDPLTGRVTFGDGDRGKLLPRGRENVRISYATGGGAAGNVPAGAVGELEGSLAFVDGVSNPVPSTGGADVESPSSVLDRAGAQLRDRNRAVAPADYERIARDSARIVDRARCLPALDAQGEYRPGWVTVLIVPRTDDPGPSPSASLTEQVTESILDRAPASLGGAAPEGRLVVRGPTYVAANVTATVAAGTVSSLATLEGAAEDELRAFLHPLTGNEDGSGWPFGELPCGSDCTSLLERLDGVDHVVDLSVEFRSNLDRRTVGVGDQSPDVAPDVLVHAGTVDVRAEGGP